MLPPMPTSPRLLPLAAATATLLAGTLCHAGVTVVFQRGQQPGSTLSLDGKHLRMEGGDRGNSSLVVDGPGKRQVVIDPARKTYMVITLDDMRHQRQRMAEARAQSEQRLKNMPPEERQRLEALMGKKVPFGPVGKPAVIKYVPLNIKRTVAGFSCQMYRVTFDGKPRLEECVAAWSAGLVQKSDFAGLRPFLTELSKAGGGFGFADSYLEQMQKAPGFPITRAMLDESGGRGAEEELKSVERGPIPPETFAVPDGYTKTELPTMGPPGTPGAPPRGGPFRPLPPPK
jgi:hypothetical protein